VRIKHLYTVSVDPGYKKGVKSSQASPETGFDSSTFPVTGGFPFGGAAFPPLPTSSVFWAIIFSTKILHPLMLGSLTYDSSSANACVDKVKLTIFPADGSLLTSLPSPLKIMYGSFYLFSAV
jgi:hypothetical protein